MTTSFMRLTVGVLALATLGLNACQKDETKVTVQSAGNPALTASTTSPDLVLTPANANTTATTFTFAPANFGYQSVNTYTLQIDKKGNNFANPISLPAGTASSNGSSTFSVSKARLANAFFTLGFASGAANSQVEARVVASIGGGAQTQTSSAVTLTGTPTRACIANAFGDWGLVGPAGDGWPGATATDRMLTYDCYTQTFSLRTTLNAGAFKFRANRDWGTNLGGPTGNYSTGVPLTLNGADLTTTGGTYTVTLTVTTDATGKVDGGVVTLKP